MKVKLLCFSLFFGATLFSAPPPVADHEGRKTFLIGTGRSGNHWLRYSLQCITKRRCENTPPLPSSDCRLPPIFCHHNACQMKNSSPKRDYLILLVRNYKECLLRYTHHDLNKIRYFLKKDPPFSYFHNLIAFDKWDPKRRIMVYYEDLIEKPEEVYLRILDLLKESKERLPKFLDNLEQHQQISIAYYDIIQDAHGGSFSKGKDHLFHSNQESVEFLKEMDQIIMERWPDLFNKYLSRYQTNLDYDA